MSKPQIRLKIRDNKNESLVSDSKFLIESGSLKIEKIDEDVELKDIQDSTLSISIDIQKKKKEDGDFQRFFDKLPAFKPDSQFLIALGASNGIMFDPNADIDDNPEGSKSWVTYFGQFVDHDITLDTTPFVDAPIDISQLRNFREPILNLDSVYGGGPNISPQLYDLTGRFILSNNDRDLQRGVNGKAIISESRNDENLIIAQIQVAFYRFHNKCMDLGLDFDNARQRTIWHHQWIILNDFLPRIVQADVLEDAKKNKIKLYKPKKNKIYMPIEFSLAAYRFGHSVVRRAYVMGSDQTVKTQVFNVNGNDLRGGRPIPENLIIQWSNFVEVPSTANPQPPVNVSRKIDTKISSGLFVLPPDAAPSGPVELAQRNLIRGKSYGLPSGQDVASELKLPILSNEQIGLGSEFNGKAPLWFYILAEANFFHNGARLGPVGSIIVADTLVGLLREDPMSILNNGSEFSPISGSGSFGDFVKFAGVA